MVLKNFLDEKVFFLKVAIVLTCFQFEKLQNKLDLMQSFLLKRFTKLVKIYFRGSKAKKSHFMSLYDFKQKYNFRPHFTLIQGLKLAILSTWPQLRNNSDTVPRPTRASFIELICKNDNGSRAMYDIFVKQMYSNPKYENKWARDLNFNPQFNWQKANTCSNILKHTKDTQIMWFLRLLHRILPTKRNLYFMRIKDNPLNVISAEVI